MPFDSQPYVTFHYTRGKGKCLLKTFSSVICILLPNGKAYIMNILRNMLKQFLRVKQNSYLVMILHSKNQVAKGTYLSSFGDRSLDENQSNGKHYLTNRIGGCLLSLLVHAVVACYSPMGSLCFYCLAIWTNQHAGHHTKRAITYKWQNVSIGFNCMKSTGSLRDESK